MLPIEPRSKVAHRHVAANRCGRPRGAGTEKADEAGIGTAQIRPFERGERVAEEAVRRAVHALVGPGGEGSRLAAGGDILAALEFGAAEIEGVFGGRVALLGEGADPDPGATE